MGFACTIKQGRLCLYENGHPKGCVPPPPSRGKWIAAACSDEYVFGVTDQNNAQYFTTKPFRSKGFLPTTPGKKPVGCCCSGSTLTIIYATGGSLSRDVKTGKVTTF